MKHLQSLMHEKRSKVTLLILLLLFFSLAGTWYLLRKLSISQLILSSENYKWTDCWMPVEGFSSVHCAWFMPEPGVKIPVAIIRRSLLPVKFKPLLYINGGPGAATIGAYGGLTGWIEWLDRLDIDHDLVLIDFAGTGYSKPDFSCPGIPGQVGEMLSKNIPAAESVQQYYTLLQACRERVEKQGHDISLLTLPRMVSHVKSLLGMAPETNWDIYGVSYGTRILLTLMREPPGNIGNVVLDSVYPPDMSGVMTIAGQYADSLDRLFSACRQSRACSARYPDLERDFYAYLGKLDKDPLKITHNSSLSGDRVTTIINSYRMIDMLFISMYNWDFVEILPMALWESMHGDNTALVPLVEYYRSFQEDGYFGDMVFTTSGCSEMQKDETHGKILKTWDVYPELASRMKELWSVDICKSWPVARLEEIYHQPVYSELSVLILSGTFDPITPPEYARKAMKTLPNAHLQVFYGMGHDLLDSDDCALDAFRDFISDGYLDRNYAGICNPENDLPEFRFNSDWY